MEPVSTIAGSYALDKMTGVVERLIRTQVIERWTRARAIEFYRAFCESLVHDQLDESRLAVVLEEVLADDARSAIVWEAYRSVCVARSRVLGPRIIAVLVARIVRRDGIADDREEAILSAAEQLSDEELSAVCGVVETLENVDARGGCELVLRTRRIDSQWSTGPVETGHGSLGVEFGAWAERLKSLGLLSESVDEEVHRYPEDSELHVDLPGTVRKIVWKAYFHSACFDLAKLVSKVSRPAVAE